MPLGPHRDSYDFSFLSRGPCCRPGGGFFENGKSVEPFDKWAIQRIFPENVTKSEYYKGNRGMGYVGPPFFDERTEGDILVGNNPPSILVQESFDSRYVERRCNEKALDFIDQAAANESGEPFFLYYGMRASHAPFNSPLEYRNKSMAGVVGDNIMELDDNVGKIVDKLDEHKLTSNTIILVLSDNGAEFWAKIVLEDYGHAQNSVDWNGEHIKLKGYKNGLGEGGHRLPMIWKWPRGIESGVDNKSLVSYIDVYATLADMIGYELNCNEAPDSRSLFPILKGGSIEPTEQIHLAAGDASGAWYSLRDGPWKFVDSETDPQLYNLSRDLSEEKNLISKFSDRAKKMKNKLDQMVAHVFEREELTEKGLITKCL
jgi:arylsulfatase A